MPKPGSKASLLIIFLTVFIDLLGFGIVLPLLPIYGQQLAADYSPAARGWILGLLMASFSAMQFLFLPVWGRLSDFWGRRPVLLIGLAGSTFFYAVFGLATMWQSLLGLFLARIGAGIAGATISTAQAYIADTTPPGERAKGMALIGAAFALGFTLGPALGGAALLLGSSGAHSPWPGFLASALSGGAFLLALARLPESAHRDSSSAQQRIFSWQELQAALGVPTVASLITASFLTVLAFAGFESTLSLLIRRIVLRQAEQNVSTGFLAGLFERFREAGITESGRVVEIMVLAVFVFVGLTLTLAQGFLVRRLADRLAEKTMAFMGCLGCALGCGVLAWSARQDSFAAMLAGVALLVVGFAFVSPSLQSLISLRTSEQQQGGVLGINQSAASLARIFGPLLAQRLFVGAPAWTYLAAAVTMLLGLGLLLRIPRTSTSSETQGPSRA